MRTDPATASCPPRAPASPPASSTPRSVGLARVRTRAVGDRPRAADGDLRRGTVGLGLLSPLSRALISPPDAAPSGACQRTYALYVRVTRREARAASPLHHDVDRCAGFQDHAHPNVPSSDVPKGCFGGLVAPDQTTASETLPQTLTLEGQLALSRARKMTKVMQDGCVFPPSASWIRVLYVSAVHRYLTLVGDLASQRNSKHRRVGGSDPRVLARHVLLSFRVRHGIDAP